MHAPLDDAQPCPSEVMPIEYIIALKRVGRTSRVNIFCGANTESYDCGIVPNLMLICLDSYFSCTNLGVYVGVHIYHAKLLPVQESMHTHCDT